MRVGANRVEKRHALRVRVGRTDDFTDTFCMLLLSAC